MKDPILENQALYQHMLFFDPLNKKAVFEKGENGRSRIYYAYRRFCGQRQKL